MLPHHSMKIIFARPILSIRECENMRAAGRDVYKTATANATTAARLKLPPTMFAAPVNTLGFAAVVPVGLTYGAVVLAL
jgi:hypothetical protein